MKQYENKADFMKYVKDTFFHSMEYKYNNKKIDRNSWLCYTRKGFPVITYPYNEDQYDMFLDIFNMLDTGYDNGTYRYGLYDDDLDYGDTGNAGLEIVGGSYVMGLRHENHDITKDGFYSNFLDEDTHDEIT